MMKLNNFLHKSLSYLLLPVMVLFTFQSAFAGNYRNQQSVNRGQQHSLIINNSSLTINDNPFKYSGYYSDSESGLYYLKARYYSPELMRFINRDTYDLSNRFAYANGNPIKNVDPTGHSAWSWITKNIINCKPLDYALAGLAVVGGALAIAVSGGSALGIIGGALGAVSGGTQIGSMATNGRTSRDLNYISFGAALVAVPFDLQCALNPKKWVDSKTFVEDYSSKLSLTMGKIMNGEKMTDEDSAVASSFMDWKNKLNQRSIDELNACRISIGKTAKETFGADELIAKTKSYINSNPHLSQICTKLGELNWERQYDSMNLIKEQLGSMYRGKMDLGDYESHCGIMLYCFLQG
jgi:RHS repeat-associated protein